MLRNGYLIISVSFIYYSCTEEEEGTGQEREERSYGSLMIERLTGDTEGRIDHVLQVCSSLIQTQSDNTYHQPLHKWEDRRISSLLFTLDLMRLSLYLKRSSSKQICNTQNFLCSSCGLLYFIPLFECVHLYRTKQLHSCFLMGVFLSLIVQDETFRHAYLSAIGSHTYVHFALSTPFFIFSWGLFIAHLHATQSFSLLVTLRSIKHY